MNEQVVVNNGNASFYPKFQNPMYLAAQKEKLRQEMMGRIKSGNFQELYPLANNLSLTEREVEEIFISWWLLAREDLIESYGLALKRNDLEQLKEIDLSLNMEKEEGISR